TRGMPYDSTGSRPLDRPFLAAYGRPLRVGEHGGCVLELSIWNPRGVEEWRLSSWDKETGLSGEEESRPVLAWYSTNGTLDAWLVLRRHMTYQIGENHVLCIDGDTGL